MHEPSFSHKRPRLGYFVGIFSPSRPLDAFEYEISLLQSFWFRGTIMASSMAGMWQDLGDLKTKSRLYFSGARMIKHDI